MKLNNEVVITEIYLLLFDFKVCGTLKYCFCCFRVSGYYVATSKYGSICSTIIVLKYYFPITNNKVLTASHTYCMVHTAFRTYLSITPECKTPLKEIQFVIVITHILKKIIYYFSFYTCDIIYKHKK